MSVKTNRKNSEQAMLINYHLWVRAVLCGKQRKQKNATANNNQRTRKLLCKDTA